MGEDNEGFVIFKYQLGYECIFQNQPRSCLVFKVEFFWGDKSGKFEREEEKPSKKATFHPSERHLASSCACRRESYYQAQFFLVCPECMQGGNAGHAK